MSLRGERNDCWAREGSLVSLPTIHEYFEFDGKNWSFRELGGPIPVVEAVVPTPLVRDDILEIVGTGVTPVDIASDITKTHCAHGKVSSGNNRRQKNQIHFQSEFFGTSLSSHSILSSEYYACRSKSSITASIPIQTQTHSPTVTFHPTRAGHAGRLDGGKSRARGYH